QAPRCGDGDGVIPVRHEVAGCHQPGGALVPIEVELRSRCRRKVDDRCLSGVAKAAERRHDVVEPLSECLSAPTRVKPWDSRTVRQAHVPAPGDGALAPEMPRLDGLVSSKERMKLIRCGLD